MLHKLPLCASILCLLASPGQGGASSAPLPLKAAIASSDLIVVGKLAAVRARQRPGGLDYEGAIEVEEQLAGDAVAKGGRATLVWSGGVPSGGVDHRARAGQRGIWLLERTRQAGRYVADHPARFRPLAERARVQQLVRSPLYLVDTSGWKESGRASSIRFAIRTFLPRLEVVDYLALERGQLRLHGRTRVEVQGQLGDAIASLGGRVARAASGKPIVVGRDRPHVVEVDLRRHFALAGRAGKPRREVFHLHWGTSAEDRSPSYTFSLE